MRMRMRMRILEITETLSFQFYARISSMVDCERKDRRGLKTVPQSCKAEWERNLRRGIEKESTSRRRRRITKTRRHS